VALQLGEGAELRAPVAMVLVGGMTTSTFLSLLFVPVSYTYFDSLATLVTRLPRLPDTLRQRLSRPTMREPAALDAKS
jgi:hydrophobic/amphiphilic exporter-1 (mainly G- bacteria), HAE1 family